MDRAVTFIEADEKEGFKVNPRAIELLEAMDRPVAVISVVGKYRTGKSFLLNRILLNRQSGFGVGPTINACTKGIWMWGEPFLAETADGEECAVILLDTEGLGALDENANHDTRIFLLALLLASTFIYNSVGSLDESALSNLSLIVNLTKQLQVRSAGAQDVDEISAYFPSLLWVLRDFALQLVDRSGNEISPKDYLENALMPQKGVSDNVEQKNRIRRYIKHFFQERDCFPLIRPSESEEILQSLDTASEDVLRPEFVTQMGQLRKYVLRRVKIKMLNGKKMTGSMLASLASAYVNAINSGSVPNIDTAWNYMCKSECERLTQSSLVSMDTTLSACKFPIQTDKLKEIYQQLRDDLLVKFRQQAPGPALTASEAALKAKLRDLYGRVKDTNERAVGSACEQVFSQFHQSTVEKLRSGSYEQLGSFKRDLDAFIADFHKGQLKGVTAEKKLAEFSQKLLIEASDYLQRQISQETQNQQRRLTQMLELAQSQLSNKKEEHNSELETLKSRLEKTEKEGNGLKAQVLSLTMQLEEQQRERLRVDERLKERVEELKNDHSERASDLKKRLEEAMRQITEMQGKHAREIAALERDKALLEQELRFRKEECEDLKAKRVQLETEAKSMRGEIRTLRNRSESEETSEMEPLREEIRDLKEQLSRRTVPRTPDRAATPDTQREISRLRAELEKVKQAREAECEDPRKETARSRQESSSEDFNRDRGEIRRYEADKSSQRLSEEISSLRRQVKTAQEQRAAAVEQLNQLQVKMEGQSPAKDLVVKSVALMCRLCGKVIVHQLFSGHYRECQEEYEAKIRTNQELLLVWVPQAVVDRKGEEKFIVSCKRNERIWQVYRSFEAFRNLQTDLDRLNPTFTFPSFSETIRSTSDSIYSKARSLSQEDKLRALERYLSQICNGDLGSAVSVQQFLG